MSHSPPRITLFDSGLGGLTVMDPITRMIPGAQVIYVADEAGFPYGCLSESALLARVEAVIGQVITQYRPDLVVIACNTASTLALPHLRASFATPFVGTVPAIKPAAAQSVSRCLAILATEGTAKRDYTRALIEEFASDCRVVIHSPPALAARAEARLRGESVDEQALLADIVPCFVDVDGTRTDTIVLGCTHYPLLLDLMTQLAPWPVNWIDPAPAIAKRVAHLLAPLLTDPDRGPDASRAHRFVTTGGRVMPPALGERLKASGLTSVERLEITKV